MAKRRFPQAPGGPAVRQGAMLDQILHEMQSEEEHIRAEAVRQLCPCRTAWDVPVQRYVCEMMNDPSPSVRHEVQHVLYEDGRWGKRLEEQRVRKEIEAGVETENYIGPHSLGLRTRKRPLQKKAIQRPLKIKL
jgi:hypothetical protein